MDGHTQSLQDSPAISEGHPLVAGSRHSKWTDTHAQGVVSGVRVHVWLPLSVCAFVSVCVYTCSVFVNVFVWVCGPEVLVCAHAYLGYEMELCPCG